MFDQVLWFATRGAGAVSLLMFTASTSLGLVTVARFQAAGWPRFFNYEMHRRVSLLSIVFLAVHVLTAVLDPFTEARASARRSCRSPPRTGRSRWRWGSSRCTCSSP